MSRYSIILFAHAKLVAVGLASLHKNGVNKFLYGDRHGCGRRWGWLSLGHSISIETIDFRLQFSVCARLLEVGFTRIWQPLRMLNHVKWTSRIVGQINSHWLLTNEPNAIYGICLLDRRWLYFGHSRWCGQQRGGVGRYSQSQISSAPTKQGLTNQDIHRTRPLNGTSTQLSLVTRSHVFMLLTTRTVVFDDSLSENKDIQKQPLHYCCRLFWSYASSRMPLAPTGRRWRVTNVSHVNIPW